MFKVTPEAWWRDVTNQRKFLEYAAGGLGVHTLEDWYKVSVHDLEAIGGKYELSSQRSNVVNH